MSWKLKQDVYGSRACEHMDIRVDEAAIPSGDEAQVQSTLEQHLTSLLVQSQGMPRAAITGGADVLAQILNAHPSNNTGATELNQLIALHNLS